MDDIMEKLNDTLASLSTPMMEGDNLAIVLCTAFDDGREETADDTGWSIAARNGYEEVMAAIRQHYKPAADEITGLRSEVERLRAALRQIGDIEPNSRVGDIYGDTQREWLQAVDTMQSIARAALEERRG